MAIRPSVPEIITVNSEALQTQIRDLLPSQNGFGSELQATNVITPVIDLTAAAEGSGLTTDLARALAFGSQTAFSVQNTNTDVATSPGFYRLTGTAGVISNTATLERVQIRMSDGLATKVVWGLNVPAGLGVDSFYNQEFDYIFWLAAGESLNILASADASCDGSIRQVADSTGTTVNPSGYPL